MEEEKKDSKDEISALPNINKQLLDEVTACLGKYTLKDIVYTLWYVLMTINISMANSLENVEKNSQKR